MAMFNQQGKDGSQQGAAETFIGPSVKLEGNFNGDGDVVIEGILTGNLTTKGDVRIGSTAAIEAEVKAKNATIAGRVHGNLTILNHLKLAPSASVNGDIKTTSLTIEEGAIVNGKILMSKERGLKDSIAAPSEPINEKQKA